MYLNRILFVCLYIYIYIERERERERERENRLVKTSRIEFDIKKKKYKVSYIKS